MRDVELIACRRFEWERLIRRARLGHDDVKHLLEDPAGRRVTGLTVTAVALALACYGNADGTRIHPGERRLAAVLDSNEKTVRTSLAVLRQVGFLRLDHDGRGSRHRASMWSLTCPVDLLEVISMLDPEEHEDRATRLVLDRATGPVHEDQEPGGDSSTEADEDRATRPAEPGDSSTEADEDRATRPAEPGDSSTEPGDSPAKTGRLARSPDQDQTKTRPETTTTHPPEPHPRASAHTRAREAARSGANRTNR